MGLIPPEIEGAGNEALKRSKGQCQCEDVLLRLHPGWGRPLPFGTARVPLPSDSEPIGVLAVETTRIVDRD